MGGYLSQLISYVRLYREIIISKNGQSRATEVEQLPVPEGEQFEDHEIPILSISEREDIASKRLTHLNTRYPKKNPSRPKPRFIDNDIKHEKYIKDICS